MKKLLAIILSAVMLLSLCAVPVMAGTSDDLPTLKVSLHPAYISTPVAYAIYNDMAKDFGFNLEYDVYASGGPQNEALGSGLWDVGVIGGAFCTSVNTYDAHVVANFIDGGGCNAVFVRKDSPIAAQTGSNPSYPDILGNADTVKGSKIITNFGTTSHVMVIKWLEALGLTEYDVELIQMDYPSGYSAFISGEADILATIGPYSTRALLTYADEWKVAADYASLDLFQFEDCVCSADAWNNKHDLVVKFVEMLVAACDVLSQDFDLTVQTYQKWMADNGQTIDDTEARKECELKPILSADAIREVVNTNFGAYERMVFEMNIESGTIDASAIKKLDTNVTPDVVIEALEALGK